MNVYHLSFSEKGERFRDYDCYSDFVIIAENEREARLMTKCADECCSYLESIKGKQRWVDHDSKTDCVWLDETFTVCVKIGVADANEQMRVCESFHAG